MKKDRNEYYFSLKHLLIGVLVSMVLTMLIVSGIMMVFAEPTLPEGVEVFHVEDMTFVRDVLLGKLVYWCTDSCAEHEECEPVVRPTPRPTDKPGDTPTSIPPTDIPPTNTPPTSIPPTEKPKCNRGLGNLSEGCDPGQSGGNPGSAGEDNE